VTPVALQRLENALLAVAVLVAFVVSGVGWWWPLVLFLAFDLSMLGYLGGPRVGAIAYNLVHSYVGPAVLALIGIVLVALGADATWALVLAGAWGFHVAADRALGYGLKLPTAFEHTHLGPIGRARREQH
jgi:hypothetical protein